MTTDHRETLVIGLVVAALSAVGMLWLIPAHTNPAAGPNDLSPALVPEIALGVCLALGVLLVVQALRRPDAGAAATAAVGADDDGPRGLRLARDLAFDLSVWAVSCIVLVQLLPRIGFIATSAMVLAGWCVFAGLRSIPTIVGVALVVPVVLDRLCWYALTVPLP
ncbi:MAG: tripartite tricarboxylate transporter TctB family protein [Hyphomicrobiales bacterium]|nr:tripartite tricarboxylate transporter TctB family protein [Hyphomicrobiales bacterium]